MKPQSKCPTTPSANANTPVKTTSTPLGPSALRLARDQAEAADAVAADVHQRPAVESGVEARVARTALGREVEGKGGADDSHPPGDARVDQLGQPARLRMMPPHEALREDEPGGFRAVEGLLDLVRVLRERLLDQHVLAGIECPQRPLDVKAVWKRDVNGLDVRVGEQCLVAPV